MKEFHQSRCAARLSLSAEVEAKPQTTETALLATITTASSNASMVKGQLLSITTMSYSYHTPAVSSKETRSFVIQVQES